MMARSGVFIGFVLCFWVGYVCDAVKNASSPTSVGFLSNKNPEINDTAEGLRSDDPMPPFMVTPSSLQPAGLADSLDFAIEKPPPTLVPVSLPSYQRPSPSPVAVPSHQGPAPSPVDVSSNQRPSPAPAPVPSYQRPAPAPVPSYQRPAPAPVPSNQRPAPAPVPSYQRPAPAPVPSYQRPAPAPVPSYQRPAPAPVPSYQRPAPAPVPSYQRPAPAPVPSYQRPAPAPVPSYQRPAPAPVQVGKPSVETKLETQPVPDVVRAICGESLLQVQVDVIQLGIGQPVHPSEITLGGCGPSGQDKSDGWMYFETPLHGCGSTLMMTEESLIYTFTLDYQPQSIPGTSIVRSNDAVVLIQCHYPRLHNVSSNALNPTWIPYQSTKAANELFEFTLRLMADDWQQERTSNIFFLGDILNIEASVVQANHVPLRVFIETCVAYLDPSLDPSYAFIDNDGCLMDSKLPGSRSMFLPRQQENKLGMQMDIFRFAQEERSMIYIYCQLKATVSSDHYGGKACSFSPEADRWFSLSGMDVCSCCDTSCGVTRKGRSLDNSAAQWEGDAFLGPITVWQTASHQDSRGNILNAKNSEAKGISPVSMIMAGLIAAAVVVGVIVLAMVRRHQKPVLYMVPS